MVNKDQSIGGLIFGLCVIIALFFVITLIFPGWFNIIGIKVPIEAEASIRFWIISIPVFIAFVAVMAIGAWIGWTMATTPPPRPIEEITSEIEGKAEEADIQQKEETKTETKSKSK